MREVRRALVESEVQLYAMGLFDPDEQARPTREEKEGPALLEHLAQESGGRHYPIENLNDLPEVSRRISLDLRNEYVLGYHPGRGARDGKYHQVKVRLHFGRRPAGTAHVLPPGLLRSLGLTRAVVQPNSRSNNSRV